MLVADTPDVISLFVQELIIMFENLQRRVDVSWQIGKKYEGTRVSATAESKRNEFIKKRVNTSQGGAESLYLLFSGWNRTTLIPSL